MSKCWHGRRRRISSMLSPSFFSNPGNGSSSSRGECTPPNCSLRPLCQSALWMGWPYQQPCEVGQTEKWLLVEMSLMTG